MATPNRKPIVLQSGSAPAPPWAWYARGASGRTRSGRRPASSAAIARRP